jgi:hypothetical protein
MFFADKNEKAFGKVYGNNCTSNRACQKNSKIAIFSDKCIVHIAYEICLLEAMT